MRISNSTLSDVSSRSTTPQLLPFFSLSFFFFFSSLSPLLLLVFYPLSTFLVPDLTSSLLASLLFSSFSATSLLLPYLCYPFPLSSFILPSLLFPSIFSSFLLPSLFSSCPSLYFPSPFTLSLRYDSFQSHSILINSHTHTHTHTHTPQGLQYLSKEKKPVVLGAILDEDTALKVRQALLTVDISSLAHISEVEEGLRNISNCCH